MSIAVGIDLGTTNSVVGVVRDGLAFTIADPNGRRLVPSTVSFHPSGKVLVGHAAVERRLIDPQNTVYSVKRLIGRSWDSEEVQTAAKRFPFAMSEGPKRGTLITARGEDYTLPEISAFVLRYAKAMAEAALGAPVDRAVITVPANFNDLQRASTKVAGKLAGLDVLRILNEPTAAALAYGQGAGVAANDAAAAAIPRDAVGAHERVAVYDLGGGTFDITLLELSGAVFEVLATAGDTALGGDDFDTIIADRMSDELLKKHRFDARANPQTYGQVKVYAERLKRELSSRDEVTIEMNDVAPGEGGRMLPFTYRMTRTELEFASLALVDRTFTTCRAALERAKLDVGAIDRVILVGGSTRMPVVARKVEAFFKKPPVMRVNPDEVVALGAAIQASALDKGALRRVAHPEPTQAVISAESMSVVQQLPKPAAREVPDLALPELPVVMGSGPKSQERVELRQKRRDPRMEDEEAEPPSLPAQAGRPLVFDVETPVAPPVATPIATQVMPATPVMAKTEAMPARPVMATIQEWPVLPAPSPPQAPEPAPGKAAPPPPAPPPQAAPPPRAAPPQAAPPPQPAPQRAAPPAKKAPLLVDVTPLSLAVETVGGFCDTLIEGNTPVPCDRTRVFLTASDNQTQVFVRVAQGKSNRFAENTFLGELELSGLQPARRGEIEIAVTFEIDADGILNVRARDNRTGRETKARMHLLGAQTEAHEIAAMQARQARHAVG
jgi:molecular chaperone DnaK